MINHGNVLVHMTNSSALETVILVNWLCKMTYITIAKKTASAVSFIVSPAMKFVKKKEQELRK